MKSFTDKLTLIEGSYLKIKVETEHQRAQVKDSLSWIKSRGDANKLEDVIGKRIQDMEKHNELCHNVLEKRIGVMTLDFEKIRH